MSFMNLLSNNAFTKKGGFANNVNMPLLLAGTGMMGNSQNPIQGGIQGLLGGLQYNRQKEQDALEKKRYQQQQARQQSMLKMQQQKFQMSQQQHQQQQAQQASWQKYINSGNFTPQQQQYLASVPMQQGMSQVAQWQKPQEAKTAKGADGYLYYTSGPKAGQRALPSVQKAQGGQFAGNSMDAQTANTVIQYEQMKREGKPTTKAQDMAYQYAVQKLQTPTTINTPNGTQVMPGIDVQKMIGQQAAGVQQAGQQGQNSVMGFTPKEKPIPAHMSKAAGYASRMTAAEDTLSGLVKKGFDPTSITENAKGLTNITASDEYQMYEQAKKDWARAKLRDESGAVISEEEIENEIDTYFPRIGDSDAVVKQKAEARKRAAQGMVNSSGRAYKGQQTEEAPQTPPAPSMTKTIGGKNYQQIDGKWYES